MASPEGPGAKLSDRAIGSWSNESTGKQRKLRGEFTVPAAAAAADETAVPSAAGAFLAMHGDELGIDAGSLRQVQEVTTPTRHIVRYQQLHQGVPIVDRGVVVQLDAEKQVIKQVDADLPPAAATDESAAFDGSPLSAADAYKKALDSLGGDVTLRLTPPAAEKVYYPTDDALRLAYQVVIPTREPAHDWRIIVDAASGQVLERRDLLMRVDGHGMVFDPNPVVTGHNNAWRDPDATVGTCTFGGTARATIDSQRVNATLRDLTFSGGKYKLTGPYVKLTNFGAPNTAPPEEVDPNAFVYSSGDARFEPVMVYYHVDTLQRYLQSLGITTAHPTQIPADAHDGSDAAFFSPFDGGLHFSDSGPCRADRAEDADCIVHEYGHAIQASQVPGWGAQNPTTHREETGAMGEGFGDALACIYFADRAAGYQREVFEDWVFADTSGLRRVDGTKTYPGSWASEVHSDGEIWSAAIWNIYRMSGGDSLNPAERQAARDEILKSVILSHHLVPANGTLPDGAEAVMNTNAELPEYRGKHLIEMLRSFHDRGILRTNSGVDLVLRDDAADPGNETWGGPVFWNSPDVWVRNTNDNGTAPQDPEKGQDNWFYARVKNRGTQTARAFVVTFNVKPWAGVQFTYPTDFVPFISAAVGFNLAPGASTIVKARWPKAMIPPTGTHACLIASVYNPAESVPAANHVWERNNLAQRNVTIVDLLPGDAFIVPFQLGTFALQAATNYQLQLLRPARFPNALASIVGPDPAILRSVFNSRDEAPAEEPATTAKTPARVKLLDAGRVEVAQGGGAVRLSLAAGSSFDIGDDDGPIPPHPDARTVTAIGAGAAATIGATLVSAMTRNAAIAFNAGTKATFPITLQPRTPISLGFKVAAPADAKPGDTLLFHLAQVDARGNTIGGISVQVNVKKK